MKDFIQDKEDNQVKPIRNNTLVSSFVINVNSIYPVEKYLKDGILLLQADIPKVIFIDELIFDQLQSYVNEYTHLIPLKKTDWYFNEYTEHLEPFELNTQNKKKDTLEFMFTMCNKTEWLKQAILLNPFHTEQFIWVDFGIRYIFKHDDDESFIKKIEKLNEPYYEKVRAGSIWNTNHRYFNNVYLDICWYFAGGVIGGHKESLLVFAEKTKDMCIRIMKEKKMLMWEVNVWYLVFLENRLLFDFYHCDHNPTLIDSY